MLADNFTEKGRTNLNVFVSHAVYGKVYILIGSTTHTCDFIRFLLVAPHAVLEIDGIKYSNLDGVYKRL